MSDPTVRFIRFLTMMGLALGVSAAPSLAQGDTRDCSTREAAAVAGGRSPAGCFSGFPTVSLWHSGESRISVATGVAFADIDGDGFKDLIVSNGNDVGPQHLEVFINQVDEGTNPVPEEGVFHHYPDWRSRATAFHGDLSVGDIDGDGCVDVAVSVFFGKGERCAPGRSPCLQGGGIDIYYNRSPNGTCEGLEPEPEDRIGAYMSLGNALADMDGDGRLDLVAAVFTEAEGTFRPRAQVDFEELVAGLGSAEGGAVSAEELAARVRERVGEEIPRRYPPAPSRIYFNRNGRIASQPGWSSPHMNAGDVEAADVDQDGFLDLVFAAPRTAVYFARGTAPGARGLDFTPRLAPQAENQYSYSVSTGWDAKRSGLRVATSFVEDPFSQRGPDATAEAVKVWRFSRSSPPKLVWESATPGPDSKLLFAELDSDGRSDLVVGRWDTQTAEGTEAEPDPGFDGAPLRILCGNQDSGFTTGGETADRVVGQALAVADLDLNLRYAVPERQGFDVRAPRSVLTLRQENVETILAVKVNRQAASRFAFVPGENWVSVVPQPKKGDRVTVKYVVSETPDLGVADWGPHGGVKIYCNTRDIRDPEARPCMDGRVPGAGTTSM